MSAGRPKSRLSADDHALWARIASGITPLRWRGRARSLPDAAPAPPALPVAPLPKPLGLRPPDAPAPKRAPAPAPAPLVSLDMRAARRLANGRAEPDARIDLHGLHQQQAFQALIGFLRQAQARGGRLALVVTGKGGGAEWAEGRGVLRANVPQWLARPEFRDLVLGLEPAARRHGGEGALYVRIRRRR